jgi:predicted ATPase
VLAQRLSQPYSLYFALQYNAFLHIWRREVLSAKERLEAVMALIRERGFIQFLGGGRMHLGWVLVEQGAIEEGLTQMHQGLEAYEMTGVGLGLTDSLALLAQAYGQSGQAEEGLRVLPRALTKAHNNAELYCEPELYRLKGELLLQTALYVRESGVATLHGEEAEACLHQAITLAHRQGAKSLELRAVMSLSRLWQQQGKQAEARQMLAEVYNWFTEGFDTLDLQEAKALLAAL